MVTVIRYKFPPEAYQVLFLLSAFLYVDQAGPNTMGAWIRQALGGPSVMRKIKNLAIGIHILEALVMLCVNIRRGAALSVTLKWVITTLILGGPTWGTFSKINHGVWG
ncbi:uncharacterized protein MRET_4184 [Malassezia restricta]|uniref:Uncharacterized protein n=1 Tax=Malassezia restricta (strain ATCC 96810 / NBRC 103918 / CBS 7877) TaxID=425264 RepID=A0A3G2S9P2_MALR7|nr:uncharacterized protein MRET_4184 [Malassezia restricta]AXA52103.1 uncharacterized protein MRET_4184 [Malassezia restricta]AYO44831.1 hypothetical protein DNF11_3881 [Malassezia restricta CBS 7877]